MKPFKYTSSKQWNDEKHEFANQIPFSRPSLLTMLRWRLGTRLAKLGWVKRATSTTTPPLSSALLRVTMIGHATVLLQVEGLNIITDPIYSSAAGPYGVVGPHRVHTPGILFEELPPIDYVIISHNHYDHLDLPTLQRIDKQHSPAYVVPLGIKPFLRENGIKGDIIELDWWDCHYVTKSITITATPAQHWSRRGLFDINKTLWMGAVITTSRHQIYFAGDTAWGPHFEQIRERIGAPTLSLLPIGAYKPLELLTHSHVSPEEAARAHTVLGSRHTIPIHFDTFPLAGERYGEATVDLRRALAAQNISTDDFTVLHAGEHVTFNQEIGEAGLTKSDAQSF